MGTYLRERWTRLSCQVFQTGGNSNQSNTRSDVTTEFEIGFKMDDVQHQMYSLTATEDLGENEEDLEERSGPSCCSRLIGILQLIAAAVLYAYVFFKVVFTLVVPASINPLLYHAVGSDNSHLNDGNVSEGEGKRRFICLGKYYMPIVSYSVTAIPLALGIAKNGGLLSLFVVQHTLMARCNLERLVNRVNLGPYSRLIYVCSTCMVMEVRRWNILGSNFSSGTFVACLSNWFLTCYIPSHSLYLMFRSFITSGSPSLTTTCGTVQPGPGCFTLPWQWSTCCAGCRLAVQCT